MTKPNLPNFNGPHPQYLSVLHDPNDSPMGQLQALQWNSQSQTTETGRIGDPNKKTTIQSVTHTGTITLWEDNDLEELAIALGASAAPNSGDTVKLDVDAVERDWYIKNYAGSDVGAALLSTIYLFQARPNSMQGGRQVDGQNVVTLNFAMQDLYYIVA